MTGHPSPRRAPRLTREQRLEKLLMEAAALLTEEMEGIETLLDLEFSASTGRRGEPDQDLLRDCLRIRTLLAQIRSETSRPGDGGVKWFV